MSLERLVDPIPVRVFMDEYFEQRYLHLARNDDRPFRELRSDIDLEHIVWTNGGAWGNVSLGRAATSPAENPYAKRQPSLDVIEEAIADGYTVVLNNVQQQSAAVAHFCRAVERFFLFRANANVYFTPADSQGLEAHYDDQDVFIVQLEGRKHWRVYEGGPVLPLEHGQYRCPDKKLLQYTDVVMAPGDVLYLPHGVIHDAHTRESRSMHLTVSVSSVRQADIIRQAILTLAEREPALRRAAPLWRLNERARRDEVKDDDDLVRLMTRLSADDIAGAVSACRDQFLYELPRLPGGQRDWPAVELPDKVGNARLAADQVCLLVHDAEGPVLKFVGGQIRLSDALVTPARFICEHPAFQPAQLPGNLASSEKLALVQFLAKLHVLELE